MNKTKFVGMTAALAIAVALAAIPSGNTVADQTASVIDTPIHLITLDANYLAISKTNLQDPYFSAAWTGLKKNADKALTATIGTVMNKKVAAPSGDMHDYISMAPYWWPNPATADGLPYIRKDGVKNPEVDSTDYTDKSRFGTMVSSVHNLSLAYYFTDDPQYATKAADFLRAWFLDPATRMNPNLRYGQAIKGVVDGRGTGLIDTSGLWKVIDAVALIAPTNALSADEVRGLRQWFADFADWMRTSPTGHEEFVWHNNHGSFYDAQMAAYYLFAGQTAKARQVIYDAQTQRIAGQISDEGKQFMELERTKPYHYSGYNLQAQTLLARYGEQVNTPGMPTAANDDSCAAFPQVRCAIDVWNFEVDGRSMKKAIDYMLEVTLTQTPATWQYTGSEEKSAFSYSSMTPVFLQAERAYKNGKYMQAFEAYCDPDKKAVERLLWPAFTPGA